MSVVYVGWKSLFTGTRQLASYTWLPVHTTVSVSKGDAPIKEGDMVYYLLPAYNEEDSIGILLEKIDATMDKAGRVYQAIVVDDGSEDRTAETVSTLATLLPICLVQHQVNKGLHQSLIDGISTFIGLSAPEDILICMDADNTHEPALSTKMVELIESQRYDVVIASRYRKGSREVGLSFWRSIMSRTVNMMLRLVFRTPGVRDFTCGYRAYRAASLKKAVAVYGNRFIESTTFSATAEILLKMGKLGIRVAEIPFVLRYDQKGGASKMKVLSTIIDYFRMMALVLKTKPDGDGD